MEENQNQNPEPESHQDTSNVSFPSMGNQPPKSNAPKTILIVGILILVGVLGFVVYKSAAGKKSGSTEPTANDNLNGPTDTTVQVETPAPIATSTPKAAQRSGVSIVVENGTGITGEAAYLQTQLKNLGYTNVKVANASSQDAVNTTVTFAKTLSSDVVSEITQKLNSIYQKVTTSTSSSTSSDVLIVTGLRSGATSKPAATSTPVATSTPKASGTPKASASPTATP